MKYILACSGGKDSTASAILAHENNEPLDEVVYCEVMFDKETSGEVPEHRDFIYNKLKPFIEDVLNVPFVILQSEKTYVDVFKHLISKGDNIGKEYGFAYPMMCAINRDCKMPPIRKYMKSLGSEVTQYVGIAYDEQERLVRMQGTNRVSLLDKYKVSEYGAMKLCLDYGLYSSAYNFSSRNGCWFCPNCKDYEWAHLIYDHEHLFDRLVELEDGYPNRARRCLTVNETPRELKHRIMRHGKQLSLFY